MKSRNVVKNYLYNSVFQILSIITPIITTPYISRVIGADGIGAYTSTLGVAQLFYIIGMIGLMNYGSRSIAYVRDDKEKLAKTFWNVWGLQVIFSIISIIIYIFTFIVFDIFDLRIIYIIQLPIVIGSIFDITWLYTGLEDFKKTVSRNILVKIIGIICIFLFVKTSDDLYKYIAINSISTFLGIMTLWIFIKEYIHKIDFSTFKFKEHVRDAFIMLIPQISVQLYTGLDRTLIGELSNFTQSGLYDQSQKISRIALGLVTSLSTVLMPKVANMFAKNDNNKIQEYLYKSINFTLLISGLLAAGIAGTSKHFVPIFFGEDFSVIILYSILTSLIVIFIPLGGVFSNQYALPTGKNKEYVLPLITASIINILLNLLLVSRLGALGGVISIVLTEFITMIIRIIAVKKYLDLKKLLKGIWSYLIAALLSCAGTILLSEFLPQGIFSLFLEVIICTLIYVIIIYITSEFVRENTSKFLERVRGSK